MPDKPLTEQEDEVPMPMYEPEKEIARLRQRLAEAEREAGLWALERQGWQSQADEYRIKDEDYHPRYQDEYQRLWHDSQAQLAERDRRLAEAERKLRIAYEVAQEAEDEEDQLAARLAVARNALAFYADEKNWTQPTSWGGRLYDEDAPASRDFGKVARDALAAHVERQP